MTGNGRRTTDEGAQEQDALAAVTMRHARRALDAPKDSLVSLRRAAGQPGMAWHGRRHRVDVIDDCTNDGSAGAADSALGVP